MTRRRDRPDPHAPYAPPVSGLLLLGEEAGRADPWPDYPALLGLGEADVPELIRMARDRRLARADIPDAWGPIHAWRALGQLRAEAAVEPLVGLFRTFDDYDWTHEDVPRALAMIGPAAIPALARDLGDAGLSPNVRAGSGESLVHVAQAHPAVRDECVRILTEGLEAFERNPRLLNSFLIGNLLDLEAREAAPLMERVFESGRVVLSMNGDWEDVQVHLGLLSERTTPQPRYNLFEDGRDPAPAPPGPVVQAQRREAKKRARSRARRKREKESRKRNRRRK